MIANQYPTINLITKTLLEILKDECDPYELNLQIKYAKLKSPQTSQYLSHKLNSRESILVLNQKLNYKSFKINAGASKQQYTMVTQNCKKMKCQQKAKIVRKLDLKFGREKLSKIVGEDQWIVEYKGQEIKRQINLLVGSTEFRLDLSRIEAMYENGQALLKKFKEKIVNEIKFMRFKQEHNYYISPYYFISISQIYQSQQERVKNSFYQAYKKSQSHSQQMDFFIINNTPKQNKNLTRYEIQLKFNEQGILYLIKLSKKPQEFNKFIGDVMWNFREMAESGFKGLREGDLGKASRQQNEEDESQGENKEKYKQEKKEETQYQDTKEKQTVQKVKNIKL